MEITATVTSIKKRENDNTDVFFRVKDFNSGKVYPCAYGGFLPIREKDNIKGVIIENNKVFWFNDLPLVIIPKHEDLLQNIFFMALRNKGAHTAKFRAFLEELQKEAKDINGIYDLLSSAACDEKIELIIDCLTFEQITVFLRWWKKNIVIRQLHLWSLYDGEIKKSKFLAHKLIEVIKRNAFLVENLEMDKIVSLEKLFGRNPGEKEIKQAEIFKFISFNCVKKGWAAVPLNYLLRIYPELPLYKKTMTEVFELVFEKDLVYPKENYEMEEFLYDKVNNWINNTIESNINTSVNFPKKIEGDITLTKEQDQALDSILKSHISIVTGGAGCGKTTLIKQLVYNLRARGEPFLLTSFTGKAVLRMKETLPEYCQECCFTMSRLIHKKNTKQPTPEFAHLIIDEASMISNSLIYNFLDNFSHYFKIYFFGDCNQLPPVGSGNFFQEIINCGKINTHYLTINKRIIMDRDDSIILENANGLISKNRNKENIFNFTNGQGFYAIEGDVRYCQKLVKGLSKKGIKDKDITILTPFNKNIPDLIKSHQINFLGQECFNFQNTRYFIGDRVMQTKNIYKEDIEIMNGEEGIISILDDEGITVKFTDKKIIKYKWQEKENNNDKEDDEESYESSITTDYLKHSFCKTVHKSQGSEYDYVIIYLPTSFSQMVNINLLYTAITRARKNVWLIGDLNSINEATCRILPNSYDRLSQKITANSQSV